MKPGLDFLRPRRIVVIIERGDSREREGGVGYDVASGTSRRTSWK